MKKVFISILIFSSFIVNQSKAEWFLGIKSTIGTFTSSVSKFSVNLCDQFNKYLNNSATNALYTTAFIQGASLINNLLKKEPQIVQQNHAQHQPVQTQQPVQSTQQTENYFSGFFKKLDYIISASSTILPIINGMFVSNGKKSQILSILSFTFGLANIIRHLLVKNDDTFNKYATASTGTMLLISYGLLKPTEMDMFK